MTNKVLDRIDLLQEDEELIPERLRQYYLETYLNVCDTCESLTHCHPRSTLDRGM
jgi:hypothetical protein